MNRTLSNEILVKLKQIIPNPSCELDFHNPFELLCAVMLSAQTTDKRVNIVTKRLFKEYPNPLALSMAKDEAIIDIIGSVGLAKTKAAHLIEMAKILHDKYNDIVPSDFESLVQLPGVGRKTASVVQAVGFQIPAMPVDTHLHRMAIRFGYIKPKGSVLQAEEAFKKYIPKEEWIQAHHLFLLFGRYYCKSNHPNCDGCLLNTLCKIKK